MDFGLSGNGELIRVFDSTGFLIDHVVYDDEVPWPLEPDGTGPSLELINPAYDNTLAQSWTASSDFGTPGQVNGPYTSIHKINITKSNLIVKINPNPANDYTIFTFESNGIVHDYVLSIFNAYGEQIGKPLQMKGNTFRFSTQHLLPGLYFYHIMDKTSLTDQSGKLMIE